MEKFENKNKKLKKKMRDVEHLMKLHFGIDLTEVNTYIQHISIKLSAVKLNTIVKTSISKYEPDGLSCSPKVKIFSLKQLFYCNFKCSGKIMSL